MSLDATLPENVVNGSSRGYVRVVGDLMSQTLEGLERLVQQPFGCGEQNMISTAPNVYVGMYLGGVDQLDPELRKRITTYMIQGTVPDTFVNHILVRACLTHILSAITCM